jgi:hypothetical protein
MDLVEVGAAAAAAAAAAAHSCLSACVDMIFDM